METPGSLIDKLITVDLKMWNNQEALYEIRRMSYDEFHQKYNGNKELYGILKKACDLNVQRNSLIYELDKLFENLTGKEMAFNPHKTY
jgi:hypothetical protein